MSPDSHILYNVPVKMLQTGIPSCGRSTYHGGCLQLALDLFCGLLLAPGACKGEAHSSLTRQSVLFINGVMRSPGYRGTTSAGITLTAASRDQVRSM